MSQYLDHPELFTKIILLEKSTLECARDTLKNFFSMYALNEWRHILWEWIEACLTSDIDTFSSPDQRADLLTRYRHIEELLEAICIIYQEENETQGNQNASSGS